MLAPTTVVIKTVAGGVSYKSQKLKQNNNNIMHTYFKHKPTIKTSNSSLKTTAVTTTTTTTTLVPVTTTKQQLW